MLRLKPFLPYLVFFILYVGISGLIFELLFNHGGQVIEGNLHDHLWSELIKKTAIIFMVAPLAVFIGLKIGRLTIGGLVFVLLVFFVSVFGFSHYLMEQLSGPVSTASFFSKEGFMGYEYWPFTFAQFVSYSMPPALSLIVIKHLTNRSSAPLN